MTTLAYTSRAIIVSLATTLLATLALASPAHAYPAQSYKVCYLPSDCGYDWASGNITWYSRTAGIQGHVVSGAGCDNAVDSTQVAFEAYAGANKKDTQTRTTSGYCADLSYNFTIGDPNLVGGIDRIKVTVCVITGGERYCGEPWNYWKKDAV
ncbi:hypothetical protein ACFWRG_08150 [Micromonospora tulbaghiae]|uniref:hypothetical protein n=1 Tax=Micromonospora tulbaghiae TaxID=479978 RepID=UPI00365C6E63